MANGLGLEYMQQVQQKVQNELKKERAGSSNSYRPAYVPGREFPLEKGGPGQTVRFAFDTTEWPVAVMHEYVPTRPKPRGWEGPWSEFKFLVCGRDENYGHGECYVCDTEMVGRNNWKILPRVCVNTIVQLRENEVASKDNDLGVPEGMIIGTKPKMTEMQDPDSGETVEVPVFGHLRLPYSFGELMMGERAAIQMRKGAEATICDRDFEIFRMNSEKRAIYSVRNNGPDPVLFPGATFSDDSGNEIDLWHEEVGRWINKFDLSVKHQIERLKRLGSKEYYDKYINPTAPEPTFGKGSGEGEERKSPAPSQMSAADPDRVSDVRKAVMSRLKGSSAA